MFWSIPPDERASHFGITLIFPAGRSPSLAAAFKFGFGWPAAMFAEVCGSVLDRLRRLEVSVVKGVRPTGCDRVSAAEFSQFPLVFDPNLA